MLGTGVWACGVLMPTAEYSGTSKLSQLMPAIVGSHGIR